MISTNSASAAAIWSCIARNFGQSDAASASLCRRLSSASRYFTSSSLAWSSVVITELPISVATA
jgi:hypothetical protein